MTLRGKILTETGDQQLEMFDEVASIFSTSRTVDLVIEEPERGLARMLKVAPVSLPDPQPLSDVMADVSITVESAGYPLLDVNPQSAVITPAGVRLSNAGTANADCTVRLRGPLMNAGITWDKKVWRFSGEIPAGVVVVADMGRRNVKNESTGVQWRRRASGDWLSIPPEGMHVSRVGSGAGSVTVDWRSSWS
ncbi:hypothetical protein [Brachybacterium massiliense]|uniref:hypothetical protein n=1 Tax=Brachybacterium massiliense TaxID=1755098 RepID=UPI00111E264A|nr:hypothetical protein [Brachybacterium massiliense]